MAHVLITFLIIVLNFILDQQLQLQGVQHRMVFVVNFFVFLVLSFYRFVVTIFDIVHDVEAKFHLP